MSARRQVGLLTESDDEEDDEIDINVDLIEDGLYLGNFACARDSAMLEKLKITHILTLDVLPLPRTILAKPNLTFHYIKLADVSKENLIIHLPTTNEFIKTAIASGGVVLVHCYYGVSRSAAVVIAYIMEKYGLCYEDAFTLVKSKRRYIGPNVGFVAQLKLFGQMGYTINKDDPRFKQFRLKFAGQKVKQVKILPQQFADLVKPDPGLVRERPQPVVYRCRKCRRVLASQENLIPHIPKNVKVERAKKGMRPPPSKLTGLPENGEILMEKLKNLAGDMETLRCDDSGEATATSGQSDSQQSGGAETKEGETNEAETKGAETKEEETKEAETKEELWRLQDHAELNMVDAHIVGRADPDACRRMWFVEPMAWMRRVQQQHGGKLHCPRCLNKIGNFSWTMGCKCPCGQKVAPAFYLVPSKVEWCNIVQNVQVTV